MLNMRTTGTSVEECSTIDSAIVTVTRSNTCSPAGMPAYRANSP